MSKTSASFSIRQLFQELGVMVLAVILASLPFAVAEAHPAACPNAVVWQMLA